MVRKDGRKRTLSFSNVLEYSSLHLPAGMLRHSRSSAL